MRADASSSARASLDVIEGPHARLAVAAPIKEAAGE
jgi:hypothetical protein